MAKNNKRIVQLALEKKLKQSQEIFKDKRFLNGLAEETAQQIKKRTQLRKGVTKSGGLTRLKDTKSSYKKMRAKFRANLDTNTSPNRSNLTATGQLLNALRGRYRRKSIEIDFEKESRGPDFRGYSNNAKNSDIVGYQEKQGRRFFELSKSEENGLRRKIANRIRKLLDK